MTTLNSLMLKTARLVTTVHDSTATGGSTSTLTDTRLTESAGQYNNGTIWLTSGSNAGVVSKIKSHGANSLTLDGSLSASIMAGDKYSVADDQFPLWVLNQAVMTTLEGVDIPASGSGIAAAGSLPLAAGVSNVMQVQVAGVENYHWQETGGTIVFDSTSLAGACTFQYLQQASDFSTLSTAVPDAVDPDFVAWGAVVFLWRQYIQRANKDNPTAVDMLNEAKTMMAAALAKQRKYVPAKLQRSPHYSGWSLT